MKTLHEIKELLHKSECLDCGPFRFNQNISANGIVKLPGFFQRICQGEETNTQQHLLLEEEGRNLLAEEGIYTKLIDEMLKDMETKLKVDTSSSFTFGKPKQVREFIPNTAIQMLEKIKEHRINDQRKTYLNEMLHLFNDEPKSQKSIDTEYQILPRDQTQLRNLAAYAQRFAEFQTLKTKDDDFIPFQNAKTIITKSIEAIEADPIQDPSTYKIRIDFFVALYQILCNKLFNDELPTVGGNSQETTKKMLFGSLAFLNNQFRNLHFPHDRPISIDDVVQFASNHFNSQDPWAYIWVCIRAGLYLLVPKICDQFPEKTQKFSSDYVKIILQNEEPRDKANLVVDNGEGYKSLCYSFLYGLDIQQPQIDHFTAEDSVFCFLASLRNADEVDNCDAASFGVLKELQNLVDAEAKEIFFKHDFQFVYSMLMAVMLKFDSCAESLLESRLFPIETIHILMVLKQTGRWDSPILPHLIYEFVHLLPSSMFPQIVDYLSFANDRKILIDYLISLDLRNQFSFNADERYPQRQNAMTFIMEEVNEDLYSLKSLHLLVLCLQYTSACEIITALSNKLASFSLTEMIEVIFICAIILDKLPPTDDVAIIGLQNSGCRLCIYALSQADELTQSQRTSLLSNVKEFVTQCKMLNTYDDKSIAVITMLSRLLKLVILFDMGMKNIALIKLERKKQIIPHREADLDSSLEWINDHQSDIFSSSLIGAATCRFLAYYLNDEQKNREKIQTLFSFIDKIPILSEETNRKLLELRDKFI